MLSLDIFVRLYAQSASGEGVNEIDVAALCSLINLKMMNLALLPLPPYHVGTNICGVTKSNCNASLPFCFVSEKLKKA